MASSLTSIATFSCLGGRKVTLQTRRERPRVEFKAPAMIFMIVVCFVVVFFSSSKIIIYIKVCNSFCNGNSFSILNILQTLWPILRVSRYRPSIFKRSTAVLKKDDVQACPFFSTHSINACLLSFAVRKGPTHSTRQVLCTRNSKLASVVHLRSFYDTHSIKIKQDTYLFSGARFSRVRTCVFK